MASVDVVYTPWSNLKKTGDMAVGQIGFHNQKLVLSLVHFSLCLSLFFCRIHFGFFELWIVCIFYRLCCVSFFPIILQVVKVNVEKKNEIVRKLEKTKVEKDTHFFIEEKQKRDRREIDERKVQAKQKVYV